ncbi:hypothetical protein [Pedobacter agri]|uniref:hypothetical protein n=1 Tax=Pedobacter agri TaxID=454586 RepID=UPI002930C11A|nr:hypothetical protein [Pedobacter agri]
MGKEFLRTGIIICIDGNTRKGLIRDANGEEISFQSGKDIPILTEGTRVNFEILMGADGLYALLNSDF